MNGFLSPPIAVATACAAFFAVPAAGQTGSKPTVVELTQVPCQFLESENAKNQGYKSARKADCETINAKTADARLTAAKTIELKPGSYIFRVTNKDVPYELGFWLRGDGVVARASLPSVSGGGLTTGRTQDYAIELKPGSYVYSCPLNPTLDYKLVVKP
jgi:hypothetical protein